MAEVRVDDVQPGTRRKEVGEFLLQPQRIEPVGRDAADDDRHRDPAQRGSHAAPAAADVVGVHRLGQRDVAAGVEARGQLAGVVVQIGLHRVAAAGQSGPRRLARRCRSGSSSSASLR